MFFSLRYLGIDPITDGDLMWIADEVRWFKGWATTLGGVLIGDAVGAGEETHEI